jgi:hypothetical protein
MRVKLSRRVRGQLSQIGLQLVHVGACADMSLAPIAFAREIKSRNRPWVR